MNEEEKRISEKANVIADKLRSMLTELGLERVYAEEQKRLFTERKQLYAVLKGKRNHTKSLEAKGYAEAWAVYESRISELMNETVNGINNVIDFYDLQDRNVWWKFFMQKKSINTICEDESRDRRTITKLIRQMEQDLCDGFEVNENGKH